MICHAVYHFTSRTPQLVGHLLTKSITMANRNVMPSVATIGRVPTAGDAPRAAGRRLKYLVEVAYQEANRYIFVFLKVAIIIVSTYYDLSV